MKVLHLPVVALAAALSFGLSGSGSAVAGPQNLQCQAGFQKVATYANSIKCKRVNQGYSTRAAARNAANGWVQSASCNAHMSPPKKKVWKKGGTWKARVTFICANIT